MWNIFNTQNMSFASTPARPQACSLVQTPVENQGRGAQREPCVTEGQTLIHLLAVSANVNCL